MGKKKDNDQFNNPFSALKGLSVSAEKKAEKKPAAEPVVPEPQPAEREPEADFFAEMAGLGVRKIEHDALEKPDPQRLDENISASEPLKQSSQTTGSGGAAQPRRAKSLRRGDIRPEAELDLHGVKASEVVQKVAWFLENSRFYGFEAVRIITGKGSHSGEGPVLRPLVEEYLDGSGRMFVVEWLRAPQKQGGEGAIVAFLRQD